MVLIRTLFTESGSRYFAESGSGTNLLLNTDPIRIQIQTNNFFLKVNGRQGDGWLSEGDGWLSEGDGWLSYREMGG